MKNVKENNLIEELFYSLSIPLNKFVFNILKNNHDTEDIVADTFTKIIEMIYVNDIVPNKAYCFTIARNLAIDFLRRKKKIVYNTETVEEMNITDKIDVFEEVNNEILQKDVENIIMKLPEVYANVFYLRSFHDITFKEIGAIMDISENNARIIHHRAKSKLKKILDQQEENK